MRVKCQQIQTNMHLSVQLCMSISIHEYDTPSQIFPELWSTLLFQLLEELSQQEAPYLQTTACLQVALSPD